MPFLNQFMFLFGKRTKLWYRSLFVGDPILNMGSLAPRVWGLQKYVKSVQFNDLNFRNITKAHRLLILQYFIRELLNRSIKILRPDLFIEFKISTCFYKALHRNLEFKTDCVQIFRLKACQAQLGLCACNFPPDFGIHMYGEGNIIIYQHSNRY